MKNKVVFSIIIAIILSCLPSFVYGADYYSSSSSSNVWNLVTITRPSGNETTFNSSYVICGVTSKKNVMVKLLRYDKDQDEYIDFLNVDGDSEWSIGPSGVFIKEIKLKYLGINKIRIVCYTEGNEDECQINDFKITVLKEKFKSAIKKGYWNFTDVMKYIFK